MCGPAPSRACCSELFPSARFGRHICARLARRCDDSGNYACPGRLSRHHRAKASAEASPASPFETQLRNTLESITDGFTCWAETGTSFTLNGPAERMLQRRRVKICWERASAIFSSGGWYQRGARISHGRRTQAQVHPESFYGHINAWSDVHAYSTEAGSRFTPGTSLSVPSMRNCDLL
jgi:hypothetical protein